MEQDWKLTNSANAVVKDVGAIAWRLQLGSAFIPAVPLAVLIFFCPESPRWLMKKGRYQKAFDSFKRLRHTEVIAARDMYYAHVQLVHENSIIQGKTYFSRFTELFTIPRVRRGTLAASTVMLAQQMCGINSKSLAEVAEKPRWQSPLSAANFQLSRFTVQPSSFSQATLLPKLCSPLSGLVLSTSFSLGPQSLPSIHVSFQSFRKYREN